MLSLRKQSKILVEGSFESLFAFVGLAAYKCKFGDEEIIVLVNARESISNIKIPVLSERTFYYEFPTNRKIMVADGNLEFDVFNEYSFQIFTSFRFEE